jgi:hypothetical protein
VFSFCLGPAGLWWPRLVGSAPACSFLRVQEHVYDSAVIGHGSELNVNVRAAPAHFAWSHLVVCVWTQLRSVEQPIRPLEGCTSDWIRDGLKADCVRRSTDLAAPGGCMYVAHRVLRAVRCMLSGLAALAVGRFAARARCGTIVCLGTMRPPTQCPHRLRLRKRLSTAPTRPRTVRRRREQFGARSVRLGSLSVPRGSVAQP